MDKNGVQRYNGALVCVVGGVMDINHEGKETQWDSTGKKFLSINRQSGIAKENPNARVGVKSYWRIA